MSKSSGNRGKYQRMLPVTSRNIGKNHLKAGVGAGPDTGTKAAQRRLKQLEKQRAKSGK